MYMLIWNIYNGHKIPRRKPRVPPREDDEMDMDGMGDFSRFPYKKDE